MTLRSRLERKAKGRVAQPLLTECQDVHKTLRHCCELTGAKGGSRTTCRWLTKGKRRKQARGCKRTGVLRSGAPLTSPSRGVTI